MNALVSLAEHPGDLLILAMLRRLTWIALVALAVLLAAREVIA